MVRVGSKLRARLPGGRSAAAMRVLASVLLAAPLAGCFIGTPRPDPMVDIPNAYRWAPPKPDKALPALDWWRGFRSRELTGLMEEAASENLDIRAAISRIVQADAQARIAGAPLIPAISFNPDITRSRASGALGTGGSGGDRNVYRIAFNASYEIDFWGKNRAALLAAEQNAVATRFDREVVALSTMVNVANAYFQVLAAQDRLRIARNNLAAASRILELIRQRVSVGTASELDTAQQEAVVATVRAAVPVFVQTVEQNRATLAVLIGRAPVYVTIRGGSMQRIAIPRVTPGLPSDLITQRPDVREAEAQLAGANANVASARAALLPTIQLTGVGGFQSTALKMLLTPAAGFYTLTSSLAQPLLDGFALQGQLEQQKGRELELLQNYRKTLIQAFADVETALVAVQQTAQRERLQLQAVISSRRAFQISETRLREGTADLVTVLQTQQTLFQAEDTLAQVRLARLQAVVSLFQALGGGWTPETRVDPVVREHRNAG